MSIVTIALPSQPGNIYFHPEERFSSRHRLWQGCPTIVCTSKGRLLAGWYSGGIAEPDMRNYNLLVRSDDHGETWSEPLLVIESKLSVGLRCIDIQLWIDPAGKCWVFWTQVIGWGENEFHETWAMTTDDPDAEEIRWSEPFYVTDGFLRCKPTVLRDGRWLLCAYDRHSERYRYSESLDQGKSWVRREAGRKIPTPFDESMILEHRDGTLRLFARTANTGHIAECVSMDGGKTWSDGINGPLTSPGSRFYIGRLRSGNLICVRNDDAADRINMSASISCDDGQSWSVPMLLDARMHTSYPDVAEDGDGVIYILHDWSRFEEKAILLTRLTEQEIMARSMLRDSSCVAQIINQPPRHPLFPC